MEISFSNSTTSNVVTNELKIKELYEENVRLNELLTKCQQKLHTNGIEVKNPKKNLLNS